MPVTFVFNCEDPNFFQEVDHFFRYFKGLKIFNLLQQRKDIYKGESEEELEEPNEEILVQNPQQIKTSESQRRFSDIISNEGSKKEIWKKKKEEFELRPFIIKIVQEIKKDKGKKTAKSQKVVDTETDENVRIAIYKKLSTIMNFPGHFEDDGINELLVSNPLNLVPEPKEQVKSKKNDSKWDYISRFRRNLFNKNKKLIRIPDPKNKFGCYYNSKLRSSFNIGKNLWLLKVCQYNRGFGIELFKDLKDFSKHLCNFKMGYEENLTDMIPDQTNDAKSKNHTSDKTKNKSKNGSKI
jgi:hypothetical protein